MISLPVDQLGLLPVPVTYSHSDEKKTPHINADRKNHDNGTKIFKRTFDHISEQGKKPDELTEKNIMKQELMNKNDTSGKIENLETAPTEKNNTTPVTEREYCIQLIMKQKDVSREVAEAEYEFLY